ncbi:hypothetical protein [Streptomyces sp. MZ04]|uniref:hypothetical protein n=1 Tax=Streptomyces sp. MZ04 TaxID=2559236 RepID=UPI00107EB2E9|nr:hypothetical protein [Streptomyces sp. MZ04]TGB07635.1 hypothetical protein E2651_21250 [Streptomyces sp. MZ04]
MTPRLRPLVVSAVFLTATVLPSSYVSYAAYAVEPSPSETFAGSVPGEGRARPGRAEPSPPPRSVPVPAHTPRPEPQPSLARKPATKTTASDATRRTAAEPVVPGLSVLPLGSGLVLIGLGLGFFAVRLRGG